MRPTIAKISIDNFVYNINQIRKLLKENVKMCVAVKADAYGHGIVQCAFAALKSGCDYVSVATTGEALTLRQAGFKGKILMLDLTDPDDMDDLVKSGVEAFAFDEEYITLLAQKCRENNISSFNVHLPVDTGMGRVGCFAEDAGKIARFIKDTKVLNLAGVCTHFACADSTKEEDRLYTQKQASLFAEAVKNIKNEGIDPGLIHSSSSAASLDMSELQFDMTRPGIVCYGYYPGDMDEKYFESKGIDLHLKSVMSFETKVVAIRPFKKGMSVSYGRTWVCEKDTNIAVLPVGYEDGLFRRFGQNGIKVTINGKSYPIVGRVCMDQCMVDLGKDSDVKRWDKVIIFGSKEEGSLYTAQDIADMTSTISYEITCGISKRVPRVYF